MLLDSPIHLTALSGRLLVVFCVYTWLVQLLFNSEFLVSADRRATARTTTSLGHAAIREKKTKDHKQLWKEGNRKAIGSQVDGYTLYTSKGQVYLMATGN